MSIDGYIVIQLNNMARELGENRVKSILSTFSCPLNKDVEHFLRQPAHAIEMARQSIAQTHLVFASYQGAPVLIGYFTLAMKDFIVERRHISRKLADRVRKFSTRTSDPSQKDYYKITAPLIAQLGKNFSNRYNKLITGDELLKLAIDKVTMVQEAIGGKIVYLECEDKQPLVDFYTHNGFSVFSKRPLDVDEKNIMLGDCLLQMLKYIS